MLSKLLLAWALMALCVAIHAASVTAAGRWLRRQPADDLRFWQWTWVFIRLAGWMIAVHLVEIAVWAGAYAWRQAMPDLQAALYFSAVTYTTTGYGDLVLPAEWAGRIEWIEAVEQIGRPAILGFRRLLRVRRVRDPVRGLVPPVHRLALVRRFRARDFVSVTDELSA